MGTHSTLLTGVPPTPARSVSPADEHRAAYVGTRRSLRSDRSKRDDAQDTYPLRFATSIGSVPFRTFCIAQDVQRD